MPARPLPILLRVLVQGALLVAGLGPVVLPQAAGAAPDACERARLHVRIRDASTGLAMPQATVRIEARELERSRDGILRLAPLGAPGARGGRTRTVVGGEQSLEITIRPKSDLVSMAVEAPGYLTTVVATVALVGCETTEVEVGLVPLHPTRAQRESMQLAIEIENRRARERGEIEWQSPPAPRPEQPTSLQEGKSAPSHAFPKTLAVPDEVYVHELPIPGGTFSGRIDLDEFVSGVVSAELGDSFPFESLKAQAVAARSFAVERFHRLGIANGQQAHTTNLGSKGRTATVNTSGIVLVRAGAVIPAYYGARCNGDATLHSEDGVWHRAGVCAVGGSSVPYARSRPCSGHVSCARTTETPCCRVVAGGRTVSIYGHGVGMCQRGAQEFAAYDGLDWQGILLGYYSSVTLENGPGLGPGDPVESTARVHVRSQACGAVEKILDAGTSGRIIEGPRRPPCSLASGQAYLTWWKVTYAEGTEGWTVEDHLRRSAVPPFATCGNEIVEAGEQCDDGSRNGGTASCCGRNCQFEPDGAASCDGNSCTKGDLCTAGVCTAGACGIGATCGCGATCIGGDGACRCGL